MGGPIMQSWWQAPFCILQVVKGLQYHEESLLCRPGCSQKYREHQVCLPLSSSCGTVDSIPTGLLWFMAVTMGPEERLWPEA